MKKIWILVFVFLFGCTGITQNGEKCFDFQTFKVLQGQIDGALAYECPWYEDSCSTRPIVYLVSPEGVDYYDEQKVSTQSTMCWVQDGVYRYITTQDIPKTVPKLKLIEK